MRDTKAQQVNKLLAAQRQKEQKGYDDTQFWKKQNDLEKFVTETRTRKVIAQIFEPLMDAHSDLKTKVEHDTVNQIQELYDRLGRVEYALYKTEDPDTRFEAIYDSLKRIE